MTHSSVPQGDELVWLRDRPMPAFYLTLVGRGALAARLGDIAEDLADPLDAQVLAWAARMVVADSDLLPAAEMALARLGRGTVPDTITEDDAEDFDVLCHLIAAIEKARSAGVMGEGA